MSGNKNYERMRLKILATRRVGAGGGVKLICLQVLSSHVLKPSSSNVRKRKINSHFTVNTSSWLLFTLNVMSPEILLVYSHCIGPGPEMGPSIGPGSMGSNISCSNVHTGLKQGQGPRPIVFFCASSVACTRSGPVQCELAIRPSANKCKPVRILSMK